jgi:hypothetical protein
MAIELHNCPDCRLTQYELLVAQGLTPSEAADLAMTLAEEQP